MHYEGKSQLCIMNKYSDTVDIVTGEVIRTSVRQHDLRIKPFKLKQYLFAQYDPSVFIKHIHTFYRSSYIDQVISSYKPQCSFSSAWIYMNTS